MTDDAQPATLADQLEEGSRVATPTGSQQPSLPVASPVSEGPAPDRDQEEIKAFSSSLASIMDSSLNLTESSNPHRHAYDASSSTGHMVLPLPSASTLSAHAYVLPDFPGEEPLVDICDLPAEVTRADISIAKDLAFIETSSPEAAREIKKRFDKFIGVSAAYRSPYAITSFKNQHGRDRYRVGARDMSAPAEWTAGQAEARSARAHSTSIESTHSSALSQHHSSQPRRRSRMSVHSFLPPVMFNKTGATGGNAQVPSNLSGPQGGSRSPPVRKLRKTRSIPNLGTSPVPAPSTAPAQPNTPTGRPHAHSVSSVDAFRPPQLPSVDTAAPAPSHDVFADIMAWNGVPPSPLSSESALRSSRSFHSPSERPIDQFGEELAPDIIRHPFGRGVRFDAPSWHPTPNLGPPPVLREMQSFDSVLTARADPRPASVRTGKLRARLSDDSVLEDTSSSQPSTPVIPEPKFEPLAETAVHSRYSTDLFDVLQNYRGLPRLDTITSLPDPPTIRLSLKADDSAAPRDDPRFVIWGEVETNDANDTSPSRSTAELSSAPSNSSRGKIMRERHSVSGPEAPFLKVPSPTPESSKRVVVAATIERWIAQLTSELNYDELLIFFLTYRTYISGTDLGHLLICRFHWALAQPTSVQDETVRRIVRVRTFIAIRYWFLTFFAIDFVPNDELRELFADWLNALRKDPILRHHKDAMSIVQKLCKVALDCKDAYTHPKSAGQPKPKPKANLTPGPLGDLTNGNFAEALRKAVAPEEDADIDLAIGKSEASNGDFALNSSQTVRNPSSAVDLAMLRQPLHLAFLQHGKQPGTIASAAPIPTLPLPVPHSALSRVVVNAIGRLGRWKRVLNYKTTNARAPIRPPLGLGAACVDASSFDIEASETGDLLMVRGGVESYLKLVEASQQSGVAAIAVNPQVPLPQPYNDPIRSSMDTVGRQETETLEPVEETADEGAAEDVAEGSASEASETEAEAEAEAGVVTKSEFPEPASSRQSSVRFSVQSDSSVPSNRRWHNPRWQMDVVSIDDLDLSDMSSTEDLQISAAPTTGLRRLPRRLPNRREFEFVRHSMDTVSSMGIRNHDSILSGSSSVPSSTNVSGHADIGGPVQQWQVDALVDSLSDDEESGDVEAALRRLEGQISQDKQRAKQSKVDGWVQSIRERLANGQFGGERRRYSSDEEDYGEVQSSLNGNGEASSDLVPSNSASRVSISQTSSRSSVISAFRHSVASDPEDQKAPAAPPGLGSPPSTANSKASEHRVVDGKPAPEDAVPAEILQSRVPSRPTTAGGTVSSPPHEMPPPLPTPRPSTAPSIDQSSSFVKERNLKRHRSFILAFKSETLVQHLSMIDRDLFLSLKFEDMVSQDWSSPADDFNVLDWGQFLRDRAKLMKENPDAPRTSTLAILRCRFNLMANFVVSEIVLTHPSERLMTHSKFIRIAWKAYLMRSFHTLVAVLAGLDSPWVTRALRQSHAKIGIWENRMLRDLQQWSSSEDDFKHIRHTVEALAEAKSTTVGASDASNLSTDGQSLQSRSRATSELKPPPPTGCIPFFGVYLSGLNRYSGLPDLIDPTAPNEPVVPDPVTGTYETSAHPEVFSDLMPLPPSVQLEPLINVHKQRLVAGVVKSLVEGQHLASRVQYDVASDRRLTQKCLKIRCLDSETLQRALALYSSWETQR